MKVRGSLVPQDVIDALWSGNPKRAYELAMKHQKELAESIGRVKGELAGLEERHQALAEIAKGGIATQASKSRPSLTTKSKASPSNTMTPEQRAERAKRALDNAVEFAQRVKRPFSVRELASDINKRKVDLSVAPRSVAATLANLLYRAKEFKQVSAGTYQLVARPKAAVKPGVKKQTK